MNFFLFDSSNSIEDIEKLKDEVTVITFDYESHNILKNKKIIHKISDEFIDTETSKKITNRNYELIKWYELKIIKEELSFHGVNIPKLFTDELISSLLKLLKKIIEVKSICQNFPNSTFYASNELYDIILIFTDSVTKINCKIKNEKFYFDEIQTSLTIVNKQFEFKISNQKYQKIKRFWENCYNLIDFNTLNQNNGFTLFVELNTEQFEDLIVKSREFNAPISYYGRRRPAIWTKKSFNIIRKSKCKIISTTDLMDRNHEFQVNKFTKNYLEIFCKVLNHKSLYDFFNIFDIPVWPIVEKKIKELIEPRTKTVIEDILFAENLFKKFKPNSIIVITEAGKTEQIISSLAKKYAIPILHLQEGLHCDTIEAFQNTSSQGVYPELADDYIVWGDIYEQDARKVGRIEESKIKKLGSPRFESLKFDSKMNSEEYVLLATMPPQIEEINGLNAEHLENYKKSLIEICNIILKKNKKIKIKLHPAIEILDLSNFIKEKFSQIEVIYQGDINPLIRNCSELIVTGLSTVILQGQILKKPVISIPLIEYYWGEPSVYKTKSCIISTVDRLDSILEKLTKDKEFRNEVIKNGDKYVASCLKNRGMVSEKIWEYIKNKK